jgi:magnesium transporter
MLNRYNYKNLKWIDLQSPTKDEIDHLKEEFNIPGPVSDELLTATVRSKVDLHDGMIYLVLHFPKIVNNESDQGDQEIDFILGKDFLITTHYEGSKPMQDFAKMLELNTLLNKKKMNDDHAVFLFFELMKLLYRNSQEELESINDVLRDLESRIYSGKEEQTVYLISKANRVLLDFRQAIRYHLETLKSFENAAKVFYGDKFEYYLDSMVGEYNKLQNKLDGHKEILNDLRETNDSLITTKTNSTVKTLTVMSFIMLPLSLIAGLFGMNADVLFIHNANDFYIVIGSMIALGLFMYVFFKFKKWI